MTVCWNESLSVNIADIDRQHQKLIGLINNLNDAMRQGKGKDVLNDILNEMIRYTTTHFKTEELYFDQFGYPDALSHKTEHANFIQKVVEFKSKFNSGNLGLPVEIMNFLSDWLQHHIKTVDRKYSPFFNERGLK